VAALLRFLCEYDDIAARDVSKRIAANTVRAAVPASDGADGMAELLLRALSLDRRCTMSWCELSELPPAGGRES
jgi:hypothetical protein